MKLAFLLNLISKTVTTKRASVVVWHPSPLRRKYTGSLKQMTTGNFMDEVVDDSEPEREELRRKEKDERKEKKRLTKLAKSREEENEIIELTDGESNAGGNTIEISGM
jgi:hypothetical protein